MKRSCFPQTTKIHPLLLPSASNFPINYVKRRSLAFFQECFGGGGTKSIVMLILLLLSDQIFFVGEQTASGALVEEGQRWHKP